MHFGANTWGLCEAVNQSGFILKTNGENPVFPPMNVVHHTFSFLIRHPTPNKKEKRKSNNILPEGGKIVLPAIQRYIYRKTGVFYGKERWHHQLLLISIQNTPNTYLPTLVNFQLP